MTPTPTRVFIYGSCVSRDTFDYLPETQFALTKYVARQSLISAFSPVDLELDLSVLASPFQRRMIAGDAAGSFVEELRATSTAVDLLIWDLFDERLGVYRTAGGYFTRTVELVRAGLSVDSDNAWEHIPFGGDRHFDIWCTALEQFSELLSKLNLSDRIVLLDIPWATRLESGGPAPASFGLRPATANALYQRYALAAQGAIPSLTTIGMPQTTTLGNANHKWGAAPFHYTDSVYRAVAERIASHDIEH